MRFLGSIRFTIILLILSALFVIIGTFIEARTESHLQASRLIYSNPAFVLLLAGFFVNILVSAIRRWPWKKHHLPFLLAHLGLLMVFGGAILKILTGIQGHLVILEGGGGHTLLLPHTYALLVDGKTYPLNKLPHGIELVEKIPHAEEQLLAEGEPLLPSDPLYETPHGYATKRDDWIPITRVMRPLKPLPKLEDNRPRLTLKYGELSTQLLYQPNGRGLTWHLGPHRVRFQPMEKLIPYHVRLRDARQINYPGSPSPYAFEADIVVNDRPFTLSMNRVYQTWDGYRFYLSALYPTDGSKAAEAQIVVSRDPFKYLLTYPGGTIVALGILLLYRKRLTKTHV